MLISNINSFERFCLLAFSVKQWDPEKEPFLSKIRSKIFLAGFQGVVIWGVLGFRTWGIRKTYSLATSKFHGEPYCTGKKKLFSRLKVENKKNVRSQFRTWNKKCFLVKYLNGRKKSAVQKYNETTNWNVKARERVTSLAFRMILCWKREIALFVKIGDALE